MDSEVPHNASKSDTEDAASLLTLGALFLSAKQPDRALKCYLRFQQAHPDDARGVFNAAIALQAMGELARAEATLRSCLDAPLVGQAAYEALSGLLLKLHKFEDAVAICEDRLATTESPTLFYNWNTAMRQTNRLVEAIAKTRAKLGLSSVLLGPLNSIGEKIPCAHVGGQSCMVSSPVTIVCVKYGTKYGADYVNILFDALRRNSALDWEFLCFTDDPTGLDAPVGVRPLPALQWDGWWYKACLFGAESGLSGRIVYFDLDTVICGNVDRLLTWQGDFGLLGSRGMLNEHQRAGINTSVMVWTAPNLASIFDLLSASYHEIRQVLHKFDHWVETLAYEVSDKLDEVLPELFIEYAMHRQTQGDDPPAQAAVVCFPLHPKPHDVSGDIDWVAHSWCRG